MGKKFINKGDLIISCKPFAFALFQSERDNRCDQCFKILVTKIPCYKCLKVMFCSRKCQTESNTERQHVYECSVLVDRPLSCMTRLVARIIKKLDDKENVESESIRGHRRDWNCLMDHPSVMYDFEKVYDQLSLIFGDTLPDVPTVLTIYGKLLINSFAVQDELMRQIGRAIYLGPSIFDHSCKPSLNFLFIGTTIYIKAIKSVEIQDIRDLRISYIDEFESIEERQRELNSQYYFECDCERCNLNEKSVVSMTESKHLRQNCETIDNLIQRNQYLMAPIGNSCLHLKRRPFESGVGDNDQNLITELVVQLKKDVQPLENVLEVRIAEFVATHSLDIDLWLRVIDIYRSYYGDCHQRLALKLYVLALNCNKYPALKRQLLTEAQTMAKLITPDIRHDYEIDCISRRSRAINRSSDRPQESTLLYRIQSELIDSKYLKPYVSDGKTKFSSSIASKHYKQQSPKQRSRSSLGDYTRNKMDFSYYILNHRSKYF